MTRLLRQIRLKQIGNKAAKKYLLYAVGEIVLVVIGILIALQISNWNETAKNQSLERKILRELRQELVTNKAELDDLINDRNLSLQVCYALLPSFQSGRNVLDPDQISSILAQVSPYRVTIAPSDGSRVDSLIGSLPSYVMFFPRIGNIKSIIYSGKLDLISNPSIKLCIAEFEDRVAGVKVATEGADRIMAEEIQLAMRSYLRETGSYPLDQIFDDYDLHFNIRNYLGWTTAAISTSMGFSEVMEAAIASIDEELPRQIE
ncbi:MAG: DUF6090 family protein [Bacteroidota bacterium]